MKKYVILMFILILCVGIIASCDNTDGLMNTVQIINELDSKSLDETDVGTAAIAPMYLPVTSDGKETNMSYHKSGLSASINNGDNTLASFAFSKNETVSADNSVPSTVGDAFFTDNNGDITVCYRMSEQWVCKVISSSLSSQELEKVLNSLTVRDVP